MAHEQARRPAAEPEGDPRDAPPLEGTVTMSDGTSYGGAAQALQTLTDADAGLAATLTRAEIDQQISTAKRYPRQVSAVQKSIESLATLDPETAQECIYVLPRGGKKITGPSVRFAEIVAQAWGNCRLASRVTNVGKTHLECTGIYHDLETNVAFAKAVTVRITKSNGQRYDDDMIGVASQAGISKALRNAILAGVPKGVWRKGFDKATAVIAGTQQTLAERRMAMVRKMGEEFDAKPAEIFQVLGVADLADVTIGHMVALAGIYTSLQTNEAKWPDLVAESAPNAGAAARTLTTPAKATPAPAKEEPKPADPKPDAPKKAAAKPAAAARPAEPKPDTSGSAPPASDDSPQDQSGQQDSATNAAAGGATDTAQDDADRLANAYEAGATAYADGQGRDTCPADLEEDEAESWLEAWDASAERDAKPEGDAADQTATDDAAAGDAADDSGMFDAGDDGDTVAADPDLLAYQSSLTNGADWAANRTALQTLTKSEYWKTAEQDDRNAAFRMAWQASVAAGHDLPDHRKDPAAFRCWLEAQDDADVIEKAWFDLASSAAYGKMAQPGRDDMVRSKKARQTAVRGAGQ